MAPWQSGMIKTLGQFVSDGRYRVTLHARSEMDNDDVSTSELVEAMLGMNSEIIEDYPDDPRGHSHLVLGYSAPKRPLHICCAVHEDWLVIITVYRPNEDLWAEDWRTRK